MSPKSTLPALYSLEMRHVRFGALRVIRRLCVNLYRCPAHWVETYVPIGGDIRNRGFTCRHWSLHRPPGNKPSHKGKFIMSEPTLGFMPLGPYYGALPRPERPLAMMTLTGAGVGTKNHQASK